MLPPSSLATLEGAPDIYTDAWLWLLVVIGLVGSIVWCIKHLGRGGPRAR